MAYGVNVTVTNVTLDSSSSYVTAATFSYSDTNYNLGSNSIHPGDAPVWFSFSNNGTQITYTLSATSSRSGVALVGALYGSPGGAFTSIATTNNSVTIPVSGGATICTSLQFTYTTGTAPNVKVYYFRSPDPESKNLGA